MSIADVLKRMDKMEKNFCDRIATLCNKFDLKINRVDGIEKQLVEVEKTAESLSKLKEKYESAIATS